ncbi:MAG: hypothetical protein H0U57_05400 [Tatlockia sp.]|nr:hypothetical protein [Tatlockia sp.]
MQINNHKKQSLFGQNPFTIHNSTNHSAQISNRQQPPLKDKKFQLLEKIGNHLVYHRYEEAKLIFKENRELLNYPIQVTSPRGYKYYDTAFQILLKNEAYEDAEDLAKYMKEDERISQFNKVFPDGEIKGRLNIEEAKKLIENSRDAIMSTAIEK